MASFCIKTLETNMSYLFNDGRIPRLALVDTILKHSQSLPVDD